MTIRFDEIPSSIRKPGQVLEFNTRAAVVGLPENRLRLLLVGQRLAALITPALGEVASLDDCTAGGTFTGLAALKYVVEIDGASTPDTFKWSKDGGLTWQAETVSVTGSAQTLDNGVTVTFGATTGHAAGDQWTFWAFPAGTVAADTATEISSAGEGKAYFGRGSHLALMVLAALTANPEMDLWAVAMDDADGATPASGTVTVTAGGSAGSFTLWIGHQSLTVAVASTDTAAAIALALAQEINATPDFPVYAAVSAGAITLTAKNEGAQGNATPLAYGATGNCATAVIVDMASGATDPSPTDALDAVAADQYDVLAAALNDATSLGTLKTHLDEVSGPTEQRPGVAVYATTGTLAAATTLAGQVNSGRILGSFLPGSRSLPLEIAAAFAAVLAGEEDPARPLNTLGLTGIHAPALGSRLTRSQQNSCLYGGVAPLEVDTAGTVRIVRAITTYTKNAQGVEDAALLDVTTIRVLDYLRAAVRSRISSRFPRAKNTASIRASIRSEILDVLMRLEDAEIVENVEAHSGGLIVEVNASDPNRVDVVIPADVVNGLHVFAGRIDLIL